MKIHVDVSEESKGVISRDHKIVDETVLRGNVKKFK